MNLVGMGRVVLARRERPIIVEPMGNGIRGITLRHSRMSDEGTYLPTFQVCSLTHLIATRMLPARALTWLSLCPGN
jgi:non-homologous end joining protein Ku